MSTRTDLATAATGVAGTNVTGTYRQSLKPLDGFVKWNGRRAGDNGHGWLDDWQIWLALHQDVTTAEAWIAANLQDLIEALDDEMVVTTAVPAELVLGSTSVNGLIIEGSREAGD